MTAAGANTRVRTAVKTCARKDMTHRFAWILEAF